MKQFDSESVINGKSASWRELTIFSIYRLFLASTLFFVFHFKLPPEFLGQLSPNLYQDTAIVYIAVSIVFIALAARRMLPFASLTTIQLVIDVALLVLIMNASGGLKTGLGSLLIVVVVAGGALIPGRLALFVAAVASISILLEAFYGQLIEGEIIRYSQVGMLGATFFITALLTQILGSRIKDTEKLAQQHAGDAGKLSRLNQKIIERLHVGVMIVDDDNNVYSTNKSAHVLLGVTDSINGEHLSEQLPELFGQLGNWRRGNVESVVEFQPQTGFAEVLPQMTKLEDGDTLIFLTDTTELTQQAQQMKLASLGHMAASIAHEIRNPLGAINHASELLSEADVAEKYQKLLTIIQRQSIRVNGIIDTVLQLSRRKILNKSTFLLSPWLENFVAEFKQNEGVPDEGLHLQLASVLSQIRVDQEQLRQIMVNLCCNAWEYSDVETANNEMPQVLVRIVKGDDNIMIDVLDNGPGVSETALPKLFEPFHSERSGGIGLGLFLSREMAQANGIRLNYISTGGKLGGYFRLTFNSEVEGKV